MQTIRWSMTLGFLPGYGHEQGEPADLDAVAQRYQRVATQLQADTGVYISCVLQASRVIYPEAGGCPAGGEHTFTLSGSCNLAFSELAPYRAALQQLATRLKAEFRQITVMLEVWPVEADYINSNFAGA